jgi:hypothetical protein
MTNSDDAVVGKSVEEIEQESGNRVNSSVQGEHRGDVGGPVLVPGAVAGGAGTVTGLGAGLPGVVGAQLTREEVGPSDGRGDRDKDSSEE